MFLVDKARSEGQPHSGGHGGGGLHGPRHRPADGQGVKPGIRLVGIADRGLTGAEQDFSRRV
jgi:hypothetical protein